MGYERELWLRDFGIINLFYSIPFILIMDELRYKRYIDKITYIQDKIRNIKTPPTSSLEKDGILYGIQNSIEAAMDTISMVIKDLGRTVKSDKENIGFLVKSKLISPSLGEFLTLANGLRNILVHWYNGVEEDKILSDIGKISENLTQWIIKLEEILHDLKKNESN